jgi:PPP family 3-phenylpropionic acid transporter
VIALAFLPAHGLWPLLTVGVIYSATLAPAKARFSDLGLLVRIPLYRHVVLIAALILGSHAMNDSFAVIRWDVAGIDPATAGVLWSLSVAAEVVVFSFFGHPLIDRLGPHGAAMMAAAAGVVRWAVMAETAWLPAMGLSRACMGSPSHCYI